MPAPTYNIYDKDLTPHPNQLRYWMSNVPFLGDLMRVYDQSRKTGDYLRNRGISWDNVKYPSLMEGARTFGTIASLPVDTANAVERLYKSESDESKRLRNEYYKSAKSYYDSWNFYKVR